MVEYLVGAHGSEVASNGQLALDFLDFLFYVDLLQKGATKILCHSMCARFLPLDSALL